MREGYTYHLTHRCHDRRYLLKFARDRDLYRRWLLVAANRYAVPIYGYCITSNHVHIVAHVNDRERTGLMMHLAAGAFARQLNRRKEHEGSVWEHPYQCTIIQNGRHLLNCLRYVSLNMVRAGEVRHPREWRWCGHDELTGHRSRYRILNIERLLQSLELSSFTDLKRIYEDGIQHALERDCLRREPEWTENLAIGDKEFVEAASRHFSTRRSLVYEELPGENQVWTIKESTLPYAPVSGIKTASKARKSSSKSSKSLQ